jgi:hypothetical protein
MIIASRPVKDILLIMPVPKYGSITVYFDLVGSINLSKFIARRQTCYHDTSVYYEVTSLIQRHGGNVLKYVGIAVIAFFTLSSKLDHCLHEFS